MEAELAQIAHSSSDASSSGELDEEIDSSRKIFKGPVDTLEEDFGDIRQHMTTDASILTDDIEGLDKGVDG